MSARHLGAARPWRERAGGWLRRHETGMMVAALLVGLLASLALGLAIRCERGWGGDWQAMVEAQLHPGAYVAMPPREEMPRD